MGDLIWANGSVDVDFRRNNHVVHVRLGYHVEYTKQGYTLEFTSIGTRDEAILMKLKETKIKAKVLAFIMTKKLPSTAKLEFDLC